MSTDEFPISTNSPGLAKLALWLVGLVGSLALYIWTHTTDEIRQLRTEQRADHETIAELKTEATVMRTINKELTQKVDRVLTILEDRRGRR